MTDEAGTLMAGEIGEQPGAVAGIVAELDLIREIGERTAGSRFVIYVARGTSDNAAVYGKYLANVLGGLPAGLAAPSTSTLYRASVDLRGCLVVGISQSGRTPDVAQYVEQARAAGAFTVAITNDETSPLAGVADAVLPTRAGIELAVPATKTFTTQLATLAAFWAARAGRSDLLDALRGVPDAMRRTLDVGGVEELAKRYRFTDRMLVAARGFNYATALEAALKLKETCYLRVLAYSAADLMHGPVAMVEDDLPALVVAVRGPAHPAMLEVVEALRDRGVDLTVIGDTPETLDLAQTPIRLPSGVPEVLSPIVAILPTQLLAHHLALEKGIDPDHPRGLNKVTETT